MAKQKESILSFWEDPQNQELIINAEPMDTLLKLCVVDPPPPSVDPPQPSVDPPQPSVDPPQPSVDPPQPSVDPPTLSQSFSDEAGVAHVPLIPLQSSLMTAHVSHQVYPTNAGSGTEPGAPSNVGNAKQVTNEELQGRVASCIGKLYFNNPDFDLIRDPPELKYTRYVTAFFVSEDTIMTVAHAFDKSKSHPWQNAVFVPGMINKYDFYGKNFGYYTIEKPDKHNSFRSGNAPFYVYDIAIVKLKERKRSVLFDSEGDPETILEELRKRQLAGIDLDNNFETIGFNPKQNYLNLFPFKGALCCTAYGFGKSRNVPKKNRNSILDGSIMSKVEGTASCDHINFITLNVVNRIGMSGGPWIIMDNLLVCGMQSASTNLKSLSPSFSHCNDFLKHIHRPNRTHIMAQRQILMDKLSRHH